MAKPAQWARVHFWFGMQGVNWESILWYTLIGAFSGSFDIVAAAATLDVAFRARFLPLMGTDAGYEGLDLHIYNSGISSSTSTYDSLTGTGGNPALPSEVAAIVRLQSAIGGGSGRGRMYVSGLDVSLIAQGRVTPTGLSGLNLLATEVKTQRTIQTQSWHPGIYSKRTDSINDVNQAQGEILVGTQRRRRPRR